MEFIVSEEYEGVRIDNYISSQAEKLSRSQCQKLLDSGSITCNGVVPKSSYKVKHGDVINVPDNIDNHAEIEVKKENIPIDIIYEDDDIIVVNKPKNMVVHPAVGNYSGTLVNALLGRQAEDGLSDVNGEYRPGIIHRLDKDTTGALVIAKNNYAHEEIAKQIKDRTTKKEYIALVKGIIKENKGTIDMPIGRSVSDRKKMDIVKNGRSAITQFEVINRFEEGYTLVNAILKTGRTHQIRVHFSHIGHPVVGDATYSSGKNPFGINSQMLHSHILGFVHPTKNEYMEFEAPLPKYFTDIVNSLHDLK